MFSPTYRTCEVDGCDNKHYSRGYCQKHYARWKRRGPEGLDIAPRALKPCLVDGCDKVASPRGLCHGHYQRLRRGSALGDTALTVSKTDKCVVDGCDAVQTPRTNLCKAHLKRLRRSGVIQPEKPIRRVNGSGSLHHGYLYIPVRRDERHLANGRETIQEHRLVMARHLGRPLTPDESVHHINGDRLDNGLENLELWVRHQPPGQRVEDLLRFARELLQRYGNEVAM